MIWRYTSLCIYLPFQTQNTSSKSRYGRGKSHTGMVYSSIYFDLCNFGQLGLYNARMKYMHFNMNIKFCLRSRWKWPAYRLLWKNNWLFFSWFHFMNWNFCVSLLFWYLFSFCIYHLLISWVSIFFFVDSFEVFFLFLCF